MKRNTLVKAHLALASVFLPFLLLMPITGGLHLLEIDGGQVKTFEFETSESVPETEAERLEFFHAQFKNQQITFDFEYVRTNGKDFTFRPTSRVHYVATQTASGLTFSRVEPDLLKRLFEIHKGHGPLLMKWIEVAFALALILAAMSGLWLAVTSKIYRPVLLVSFASGLLLILLALI